MEGEAITYLFRDLKIKQNTVFDFEELYQTLFRWFEVNDYDFYEKEYSKTERGAETDLVISWVAEKKTENDYLKYVIEVDFSILGLQDAEIEKDGLKFKTNKAGIEIKMTACIVRDIESAMEKKFGKIGRNFYERIIKEKLDQHEVTLFNETHMLIDEIKSFLAMHRF